MSMWFKEEWGDVKAVQLPYKAALKAGKIWLAGMARHTAQAALPTHFPQYLPTPAHCSRGGGAAAAHRRGVGREAGGAGIAAAGHW